MKQTKGRNRNQHCVIQCNDAAGRIRWLEFTEPERIIDVSEPGAVLPALHELEQAVVAGYSVAGFLTYEAASGLDSALQTAAPGSLPLLRFGIYRNFTTQDALCVPTEPYDVSDWSPSLAGEDYAEAIDTIKDRIARGETYQVNFTLRLRATFHGNPAGWFQALHRAQRPRYAAFIEYGDHAICSVSPELFFALDQQDIVCRPMKGTARRGMTWQEDEACAERLHQSPKDRAENLMIVDMMRNDLGRIADTGTVHTEDLFEVERYPTVLQMASTVRARTSAGFPDILKALFPSCSITGAPKVRTMEIIEQLEPHPRGIYTGSIGFLTPCHPQTGEPGRFAQFNVAIRTAHIRKDRNAVEYGTGGGIVWDSEADTEYHECRTKALILSEPPHDFSLLETMLWKPGTEIFLLDAHLQRLEDSAHYFGISFSRSEALHAIRNATAGLRAQRYRVRMLVAQDGGITVESAPIERARPSWTVAVDDRPVDRSDPFLYHKTTQRAVYEQARARHPGANDVLLWNSDGEITESCVANVLLRLDGVWYTPPIASGLLNGTMRSVLVHRGRVREKVLTKPDLQRAETIALINSVRGFIDVTLA